jgi:hypothetical protein
MRDRITPGREILVRRLLILIRAALIALARGLITVSRRLVPVTCRLVAVGQRLILIARRLIDKPTRFGPGLRFGWFTHLVLHRVDDNG